MSRKVVFPPRRRDWKPGLYQIGLFVRMSDGSKIEVVCNAAPDAVVHAAADLALEMITELKRSK